jgi:hypothetical protein
MGVLNENVLNQMCDPISLYGDSVMSPVTS